MEQAQLSEIMADSDGQPRSNSTEQPIPMVGTVFTLYQRWWPVALLSLLYIISLTDRLILAILIEPLKHDLQLTDTQVALLIGSSFAFFYGVIGFPVAWALDKGNRMVVGVSGVAIWSLSTIASGLVNHFGTLIALRIGVAIGESVLSPLGVSLVADLFPRHNRSAPMSIFIASGIVGIFAAYAMGGGVVSLLEHGFLSHVPLIGALPTWRTTLLLIGLPGVFLAFIMACTVRDPKRRMEKSEGATARDDRFGAFGSKTDLWRFYICYFAGSGIIGIPTCAALVWYPSFLVRVFNVSLAESGWFFSLSLICAVIVLLSIPHVMRYGDHRWKFGSLVPVTVVAASLGSLFFGLSLVQVGLVTTLPLLIVGYGLLAGGVNALPAIAVALTAPSAYRGRIIALGGSSMGIVAMGLGPYFAALLADHLHKGPRAIAHAMLILTIVAAPLACVLIGLSWAPFNRALGQKPARDAPKAPDND